MTFNTRTTYTEKPVRLAIRLWGAADQCTMSQVPICIPWHREYWNIQLKAHLKPHSIKSSNTPAWPYQLLVCMSLVNSHQQHNLTWSHCGLSVSLISRMCIWIWILKGCFRFRCMFSLLAFFPEIRDCWWQLTRPPNQTSALRQHSSQSNQKPRIHPSDPGHKRQWDLTQNTKRESAYIQQCSVGPLIAYWLIKSCDVGREFVNNVCG